MTQNDFLEKFSAQFEETDPSTISLEAKFRELDEWSSMMALIVIAMVDEEYDITLTGDDIRAANTVKDIYDTIVSKS